MANEITAKINMSKTSGAGGGTSTATTNNSGVVDDPRAQSQRRESSSTLRLIFHTNAMETAIYREEECDNELIKMEQQLKKQRSGNLYNSIGRVIRPYESVATLPEIDE